MGGIQKNLGGQFTPFLGDQFESAGGGQFETANGGQFVPALGGQFDRHFQICRLKIIRTNLLDDRTNKTYSVQQHRRD